MHRRQILCKNNAERKPPGFLKNPFGFLKTQDKDKGEDEEQDKEKEKEKEKEEEKDKVRVCAARRPGTHTHRAIFILTLLGICHEGRGMV